jgi:hypothetical protein
MGLRLAFAVLGAMIMSACAPVSAEPTKGEPLEITLTRTVCFGYCPAYSVTINGAGEVRYEGRAFVNVVGEARGQVAPEEVARLVARFDEIGFDRLRDRYEAQVTDLPTYTVSIRRGDQVKTVVDYAGTAVGMPQAVRALQDEIDRVAGTGQWVLRNGQPVQDRPHPQP